MKNVHLTKKGKDWVAQGKSGPAIARARTKDAAIKKAAAAARRDPQSVSLKIHNLNGRIAQERTYPRRADPPRSKG